MLTPQKAAEKLCPLARLFGDSNTVTKGCRGDACMAWVWEEVTTAHPMWKDAVKTKAAEIGENVPYAKAARWVADHAEELGMVPERGCCGLAGK